MWCAWRSRGSGCWRIGWWTSREGCSAVRNGIPWGGSVIATSSGGTVEIKTPNGRVKLRIEGELRGADLSGKELAGVTLANQDLRGTRFSGARLVGVDFSEADLQGAHFDGANLTGAHFEYANLERRPVSSLADHDPKRQSRSRREERCRGRGAW